MPAFPVKNTFWRCLTSSNTSLCSQELHYRLWLTGVLKHSILTSQKTFGMAYLLRGKLWAASFISIWQGGRCLRAPFNGCPFLA